MIPELGHFALILALMVALVQGSVPFLGAARGHETWMALGRPTALLQLLFVTLAFLALTHAYVTSDFTVATGQSNVSWKLSSVFRTTRCMSTWNNRT